MVDQLMVRARRRVPPRPPPGPQLAAHGELTDVAEAAQEGAQGGWRLESPPRVQAVPPVRTHRRQCSRPQPAQTPPASSSCRPCSPAPGQGRGAADEFGQAEVPPRVAGSSPASTAAVVEGDLDRSRGSIYWLLFRGRFFATKPLSQKHEHLLGLRTTRPSFGGFG